MQKPIKISQVQLTGLIKESVRAILKESTKISEYVYDGHVLSVKTYSREDDGDMEYIRANKGVIWDILTRGYESLGGFKGFETIRDMLRKCPLYRLGYYDGDLVTVTVYNGYLGGTKCVGRLV